MLWPRQTLSPEERSLGTSPVKAMNPAAWAKRRQSPTSAATANAPSWPTPRSAASRATASANGALVAASARSASMAVTWASRLATTAR